MNDETEHLLKASKNNNNNILYHHEHDPYITLYLIMIINILAGFTFSSILAILAIYLNENMHFDQSYASFLTNCTVFAFYTMALCGGLLADYKLGKVYTIFIGISSSIIATTLLYQTSYIDVNTGMTHTPITSLYLALFFFSFTGMLIPSSSALVGDQFIPLERGLIEHNYDADEIEARIEHAYGLLYSSFNYGAIAAMLLSPSLTYLTLFNILPILGLTALSILTICDRYQYFVKVIVSNSSKLNIKQVISKNSVLMNNLFHIYLPLPLFWALFYCIPSLWTFSAEHMNRRLPGGYVIPAGSVSVLNPILDVILIQVFDLYIYPILKEKQFSLKPVPRLIAGMIFTAFALYCAALLELRKNIHIIYILPQFILMSFGEILISVTSLQYSYQHAPKSMKTIMISCFFFTQAMGNLLISIIDYFRIGTPLVDYIILGSLMLFFCLIYTQYVYKNNALSSIIR